MATLPRNLLGRFRRRNSLQNQQFDFINPSFQNQNISSHVGEEYAFLSSFEQTYGLRHPFFYTCTFTGALRIAEEEKKFLFVYLHEPSHPFAQQFCRETLCSDMVIQFLDVNFVSWGAMAARGEAVQLASTLRLGSFPLCAVVAPATNGDSMTLLQQMEGPISPGELVEILLRTKEEQGLAFCERKLRDKEELRRKAKNEGMIREDRKLRDEQDAAYMAALKIDKERERVKSSAPEKTRALNEVSKKENNEKMGQNPATQNRYGTAKPSSGIRESQRRDALNRGRDSLSNTAQILIRFPNGERREKSFSCTDKVQSVYWYIDSLGIPGIGNYRLVSSFPRRIYGIDQMGMSLKDAGLYPRASLFLELMQ